MLEEIIFYSLTGATILAVAISIRRCTTCTSAEPREIYIEYHPLPSAPRWMSFSTLPVVVEEEENPK